jgi:hypothetical protein
VITVAHNLAQMIFRARLQHHIATPASS